MNVKVIAGSALAVALVGVGMLVGSTMGAGNASAQAGVSGASSRISQISVPSKSDVLAQTAGATAVATTQPAKATITQAQAEQAALTASPGNIIDHTRLGTENGVAVYDVDFTNGGGVIVNAETGAVITVEAAGQDKGGGPGGRGGHSGGGADQAALLAKATVKQADAEKIALAASPGNTIDHSRLGDDNGTIFWDVDFTNGGGVTVNALTGAVIATEAAGTDSGGHRGRGSKNQP